MSPAQKLSDAVKEFREYNQRGQCTHCDPTVGYTCDVCYLQGKMWKALHELEQANDEATEKLANESHPDSPTYGVPNADDEGVSSPPKHRFTNAVTFTFSGPDHPKCFHSIAAALAWLDDQQRCRTTSSALSRILSVCIKETDGACHAKHLPPELAQDRSRWFVTVRRFLIYGSPPAQ